MKILISGYYGFDNCGDDAVLECLINDLKDKNVKDIFVLSNNPNETKEYYNVSSIYRNSYKEILTAIKSCDVVISGGGSLLQDKTSSKSLWYYLAIIFLGIFFRKKVYIIGQGIGPINKKFNRWITKVILKRVNGITVRDSDSKRFLESLKIKNDVILSADPVVNMESIDDKRIYEILSKEGIDPSERYMIICTRAWETTEISRVELAKAIDTIANANGMRVIFFPFYYKVDEEESQKVANYLKSDYKIIKNKYNPKEVLGIIKKSQFLIGVRLHALIFGLVANIPFIGISYDPKIDGFLKSIDVQVFKIDKFTSDEIINYADYIIRHNDEFRSIMKERLEKLKDLSRNNMKIF